MFFLCYTFLIRQHDVVNTPNSRLCTSLFNTNCRVTRAQLLHRPGLSGGTRVLLNSSCTFLRCMSACFGGCKRCTHMRPPAACFPIMPASYTKNDGRHFIYRLDQTNALYFILPASWLPLSSRASLCPAPTARAHHSPQGSALPKRSLRARQPALKTPAPSRTAG